VSIVRAIAPAVRFSSLLRLGLPDAGRAI